MYLGALRAIPAAVLSLSITCAWLEASRCFKTDLNTFLSPGSYRPTMIPFLANGKPLRVPSAELMVVFKAVKFGKGPHTVTSTNVIDKASGRLNALHPMSPHLDLWRKCYEAIDQRGC